MKDRAEPDSDLHAATENRASTATGSVRAGLDVHDALVTSGSNIEITADEKRRILRERAKRLALRPQADDSDRTSIELIEFMLAHERYALDVSFVREVYPLKDLTPVPCTPPFVLGIINVRGQVISVLDVREFFDLPRNEITDAFKVLIVKNSKMEFGILADSVIGERRIPVEDVQTDMPGLKGIKEEYVRGVTKDRLIIMNVDKLLSDGKIVVHQEVGD